MNKIHKFIPKYHDVLTAAIDIMNESPVDVKVQHKNFIIYHRSDFSINRTYIGELFSIEEMLMSPRTYYFLHTFTSNRIFLMKIKSPVTDTQILSFVENNRLYIKKQLYNLVLEQFNSYMEYILNDRDVVYRDTYLKAVYLTELYVKEHINGKT